MWVCLQSQEVNCISIVKDTTCFRFWMFILIYIYMFTVLNVEKDTWIFLILSIIGLLFTHIQEFVKFEISTSKED